MNEAELAAKAAADKATADAATAAAAKTAADAAAAAAAQAEADRVAAEKAAAAAAGTKPTDAEAKLLKEVMERKASEAALKEALKQFEGIDPTQVKAMIAERKAAADAAKKAEEDRLAAAGNWDQLKAQMNAAHDAEILAKDTALTAAVNSGASLAATIADLTVGGAFTGSTFIGTELALTPTKARVIYGSHFEYTEGKVVAFDKPAGATGRTMLVGARGEPLAFEDAIKKIIDADPEKDHMLRSKIKPGVNSTTLAGVKIIPAVNELSGRSKIAAGLAANAAAKK